jgi:hypothetical protein
VLSGGDGGGVIILVSAIVASVFSWHNWRI